MNRDSSLGVTLEGSLLVREKRPSYRSVVQNLEIYKNDPVDRMNTYMEFVKEVGDGASEDTKRKLRKRLGL
jgi:hypothetical protein